MSKNDLLYFDSDVELFWHGVVIAAAVLLGYLLFFIFARTRSKRAIYPVSRVIFISFPLSLVLSRAQYCLFRRGEFSGIGDVLRLSDGGFGLYGAMLGTAAAIFIVRIFDKTLSLAELLDAAAVSGAASVCLGRAGCFFSHEENGFALTDDRAAKLMFTAFNEKDNVRTVIVYPYEAITAGIIFIALAVTFILIYKAKKYDPGTAALRFLFLYSVTQTLWESWRSDPLFLNTLGFVRFSQALSAVIFAAVLVYACIRYVKKRGFRPGQIILWVSLAAMTALAFVCEFTMTGNTRLRNYSGMGAGLLGVMILGGIILSGAQRTADGAVTDGQS